MAGGHGDGHYHPVKIDPAVERWNLMRENTYQTFKFNRKITQNVIMFGLVVPAAIGFVAYRYDNVFDWAGKMKGSNLRREAPANPIPTE